MSACGDTPDERDEKAQKLASEQTVRAKDLRRFKRETRFLYTLAVALVVVVVAQQARIDRVADETIASLRDGCEGVNALRVNQAGALIEQIEQTRRSLRGNLGSLERFRVQAQEGIKLRVTRLARLRVSVADHPLRGRAAMHYPEPDRPYRVDCASAYP